MPLKNLEVEKVMEIQSLRMTSDPRHLHSKVRQEQYALSCMTDAGSSLAYMYLLFFSCTYDIETRD